MSTTVKLAAIVFGMVLVASLSAADDAAYDPVSEATKALAPMQVKPTVSDFDAPVDSHPIGGERDVRIMLSLNGAAVLLLGILPGGLMQLCAQAIVQMFST